MIDKKSQGIIRDKKGQEQPADKKRAQQATKIESNNKAKQDVAARKSLKKANN
jgi:hypothetical protein